MREEIFRWGIFHVIVALLLLLDLGFFQRKSRKTSVKEAALWSCFWIAISLGFNFYVYLHLGPQKGLEFFTGYLVEKSLSVDNLFIFVVIFSYFKVPLQYHHRVLFYGIIGAIILRLGLILGGIALLRHFHFFLYVFALLVGFSGIRLMLQKVHAYDPSKNIIVRRMSKWFLVTKEYHDGQFFIRRAGKLWITPLLIVLAVVETTDLLFALDSIPAIFAITTDPYIVYTSNVFALLGLRSLHMVLTGFYHRFEYMKTGLGAVLIFIAVKMLASPFYELPLGSSLAVIAAILTLSAAFSWARGKKRN